MKTASTIQIQARTLKQIFELYPLKPGRIAISLGRSREWITRLSNSHSSSETNTKNLMIVFDYLHDIGLQLSQISLSGSDTTDGSMNIQRFFREYPISVSAVADHMGHSREWLSKIVFDRYSSSQKARIRHINTIQGYIRKIGSDLSKIAIITQPSSQDNITHKPKIK